MTQPPSPPKPRTKPWYATWWAIALYAVVGLCLLGTIGNAIGGGTEPPDTSDTVEAIDELADNVSDDASDLGSVDPPGDEEEPPEDFFEAQTYTGSGDETIDLPEGVVQGMITASHDGSGAFILSMLDGNNEATLDGVTEIGAYEGTVAFGLSSIGNDPTRIEVTADGNWEITVAHLSTAPVLALPIEGESDAVYQYATDAADWTVTHDGDGAFIVNFSDQPFSGVMEIGVYEGTHAVPAGEGIVTIIADGKWTISAE